MRFLMKLMATGVVVLGLVAAAVLVAPMAYAQVRTEPLLQLRTDLLGGPQLGVRVRDVDEADVRRDGLTELAGVVVEEVNSDGAAADAGIRAGDVIMSFDGERVRSARHFGRLVDETPDRRQVEILVLRGGERMTIDVTPEPSPATRLYNFEPELRGFRYDVPNISVPEIRTPDFDLSPLTAIRPGVETIYALLGRGRLGVSVQALTDQLAEFFGVEDGLLVTSVDDDTPAHTAGIRAGDIITKIDGRVVDDANDLRRFLDSAEGDTSVTVMRDGREQTLTANIDRGAHRPVRRIIR